MLNQYLKDISSRQKTSFLDIKKRVSYKVEFGLKKVEFDQI